MTPRSDSIGLKFGVSSIHGYMNVFCDFEQNRRSKCFFLFPLAWNNLYNLYIKYIVKEAFVFVYVRYFIQTNLKIK